MYTLSITISLASLLQRGNWLNCHTYTLIPSISSSSTDKHTERIMIIWSWTTIFRSGLHLWGGGGRRGSFYSPSPPVLIIAA